MSGFPQSLVQWVENRLVGMIGTGDFAPVLLSIANEKQLRTEARSILGNNSQTKAFISELIKRRNTCTKPKKKPQPKPKKQAVSLLQRPPSQSQSQSKSSHTAHHFPELPKFNTNAVKNKSKNKNKLNLNAITNANLNANNYRKSGALTVKRGIISKKTKKKLNNNQNNNGNHNNNNKKKSSKSSKSKLKMKQQRRQQRVHCGCQATLHEVFKNCTECGNILCILEGEGECHSCGSFVTRAGTKPKHPNRSGTNNRNSTQNSALQKAVQQKNMLLKFGRERAIRTKIIDDQGDFYETEADNLWLSRLEREHALHKAQENQQRLNACEAGKAVTISLDVQTGNLQEINDDPFQKYQTQSVDRETQLKQKLQSEQQRMQGQNVNIANNFASVQNNQTLSGHASQIHERLQKMLKQEREKAERMEFLMSAKNNGNNNNSDANNNSGSSTNTANKALKKKLKSRRKRRKKHERNKSKMQDGSYANRANVDNSSNDEKEDADHNNNNQKKDKNARTSALNSNAAGIAFLKSKSQSKSKRRRLKKHQRFTDRQDMGVCLSMHQPWASLLVLGIKRVEGRSWPTRYRGRLWIASARRQPTPFEIATVEEQYCQVFGRARTEVPFPNEYPTAALLGCVDLVDCLSNAEYTTQFIESGLSTEENQSGYCFVCENPRRLILPGTISGDHKLWRMPTERIKPMQSGLIPCDTAWINSQ